MTRNIGLIALEGNRLADLLEFFGETGYRLAGVDWLDTKAAAELIATPHPSGNVIYKPVYFDTTWTIIVDNDIDIAADIEALGAFSKAQSCQVCACVCAGNAASYGFVLFASDGQILRAIDIAGGKVDQNDGSPLKGEPESLAAMDDASTLALFARTVSPYDAFEVEREYTVYSLVHRERERQSLLPKPENKSWWKFW